MFGQQSTPSADTNYLVTNITETTDYRVVVMSGPCAEATSVPVTVVVEPTPEVVITNAKPTVICKDDVVSLNVTVSDVTAGTGGSDWTINYTVNGTAASFTGTGNGTFSELLGSIGVDTEVELVSIVSTGSNGMKCNNADLSDKFEIKVNDIPTATITSNTDSVCNNSTANVVINVDNVKVGESWTVSYNVGTTTGLTKTGVGPGTFTIVTPALTTGTYT